MRFLVIVLILGLPAFANAGEVYKWRDKYGNVHYSDKEPQNQDAQRKQVKAKDPKPAPVVAQKPVTVCERLQNNIDTLGKSVSVQMDLNNDGTPEVLSPEQREQQLKTMQAAYTTNCAK